MIDLVGDQSASDGSSSGAGRQIWRVLSVLLLLVAVGRTALDDPGPVKDEDPRIYVEAAESITHWQYRSDFEPSGLPRYPPGYPIVLAPFVAAWGDEGAIAISTIIGVLLVGLMWVTARRVGGDRAAAVALVLWMLSPLTSDYSTEVMSDPLAALTVLVAVLAARRRRWIVTGALLGWGAWIRLASAAFVFGLGRRWSAWITAALVLVPLAVFQLVVYGRLAGYDDGQAQFGLSNIWEEIPLLYFDRPSPWPNWQFFPGLLWGLSGGLVPLLPVFAGVELFARRSDPAARLAAWIIVANVAVYLPYFYQAPRFVLPAACLVIVYAAAGIVRVVDRFQVTTGLDGRARASVGLADL